MNSHLSRSIAVALLVGCVAGVKNVAAVAPIHFWSQRFGNAGSQLSNSIAVDAAGNIVVAGQFQGTMNFGGSDLVSTGLDNIFVAKFDPSGAHLWSYGFGDGNYQYATSVAVDASGNVVITGILQGSAVIGFTLLTSAGAYDVFVSKFNSAGVHQWSVNYGDADFQFGEEVAVDAAGNIFVAGNFLGAINFGGANLTSAGGSDIFVAKFNANGAHQWSQRFGDASSQVCYSAAVDASGSVIATGYFDGTVNFGGSNLVSAGFDIFLTKHNSAGVHQWSYRFGDALAQAGNTVTTDDSENVILIGSAQGTVDFGGGPLTSAGSSDAVLAKFSSTGVHQWSKRFGDASDTEGVAAAADLSENIIITGYFSGTVNFGGSDLISAGGSSDIFIARFDAAGNHHWSRNYGDANAQSSTSLAVDGARNVAVTGSFSGTVDFGGALLMSAGSTDIYVVKFSGEPPEPAITGIADIGNDQGRQVRIRFLPSGHDDLVATTPLHQYQVYRREGAFSIVTGAGPPFPDGESLVALGWDFVGIVPANGLNEYQFVAPTLADSTIADGQHFSTFIIRAVTDNQYVFYDSPPDSGYSLDNLSPGVPTSFAYAAGQLTWDQSKADDFDYFSVYGGSSGSFASATLIDYTVTPAMDVAASPYTFYFATATDFSGNEGNPAVINTLSGVGGTPTSYVLSISSYPNPFNPETTIRYTVPSKGRVEVDVYGLRGARVVMLVDEEKDAGAYTKAWDGRDAGGRTVSSGVYFARVAHPSGTKSYKMVLLK